MKPRIPFKGLSKLSPMCKVVAQPWELPPMITFFESPMISISRFMTFMTLSQDSANSFSPVSESFVVNCSPSAGRSNHDVIISPFLQVTALVGACKRTKREFYW